MLHEELIVTPVNIHDRLQKANFMSCDSPVAIWLNIYDDKYYCSYCTYLVIASVAK